jgi:hypothetical protein
MALVGISVVHAGQQIEYWLRIQVHTIANERLGAYPSHLKAQWLEELSAMGPMIAQYFQEGSIEYVFRMRYQANTLRMWFARSDQSIPEMAPLAESPVPKDLWISPEAEVVTYPPILNEQSEIHAEMLFS